MNTNTSRANTRKPDPARRRPFCPAAVIAALFILFIAVSPVLAGDPHIGLIAADERGVTLELAVPAPNIEQIESAGQSYVRVRVPGWAATSQPGRPELPVRGILIEVPRTGQITLEITEAVSETIPGLLVYPLPPPPHPGQDPGPAEPVIDKPLYTSSIPFPLHAAEVERVGIMRGIAVARVMFSPFRWNPATRELLCYKKIIVKVSFSDPLPQENGHGAQGPEASSPREAFGRLHRDTLVNYSPARAQGDMELPRPQEKSRSTSPAAGVKITVKRDGMYRLSYGDLKKIGVKGEAISADTFRLLNGTNEIPLMISAKDKFSLGSYIDFYAKGLDTPFTDTNVYYLVWGGDIGKRMNVIDGAITGQGSELASFMSTVHVEQNRTLWMDMPEADTKDYWFWEKLTAPAHTSHIVTLPAIGTHLGTATVRVSLRGISSGVPHPDHHTKIALNGVVISDERWDGTGEFTQTAQVSMSLLKQGDNILVVRSPGDTGASLDSIYVNWIEVAYPRRFQAVNNELAFAVQGAGRVKIKVTNVSGPKEQVYDVTDPSGVSVFKNCTVSHGAAGYAIAFEDTVAGQKTYFVTPAQPRTPLTIQAWNPADLGSATNGADYIIITPREFLSSVAPLQTARETQGLRVMAVATEDIYDGFNAGIFDPQAIKAFLSYAYNNWTRPAPTYVLLVGDANFDYRNYLNWPKKNRVPVHLSVTSLLSLTPDDNWYVAVDGDDVLPDMMIGRIPAANAAAASAMVRKIVDYEALSTYDPKAALFAADWWDPDFAAADESFITYLPADILPRRVYLPTYPTRKDVIRGNEAIIAAINNGMFLTTYVGHADPTLWAEEGFFGASDVARLSNTNKLTFVLTLACFNGFFSHPSLYSTGESFVMSKKAGAIASFSTSGYAYSTEFEVLGNTLFSSLFEKGNRVLGNVTIGSKIEAYSKGISTDTVRAFTLFGDPALRLKGGN